MKKLTSKTPVVVIDTEGASLVAKANGELTGVRKAAMAVGRRLSALEEQAEAIHARTLLNCTARVISTKEGGIHALLTDANGVTVEIAGGELAAAIAPKE